MKNHLSGAALGEQGEREDPNDARIRSSVQNS